jgi:hypothetical protein
MKPRNLLLCQEVSWLRDLPYPRDPGPAYLAGILARAGELVLMVLALTRIEQPSTHYFFSGQCC